MGNLFSSERNVYEEREVYVANECDYWESERRYYEVLRAGTLEELKEEQRIYEEKLRYLDTWYLGIDNEEKQRQYQERLRAIKEKLRQCAEREIEERLRQYDERQRAIEERRSRYEERQRAIEERRRKYEEKQRAIEESRRQYEERQRAIEERSRYEERQRAIEERRRNYEERQRAIEESRRQYEERQRAIEESRRQCEERQRARLQKALELQKQYEYEERQRTLEAEKRLRHLEAQRKLEQAIKLSRQQKSDEIKSTNRNLNSQTRPPKKNVVPDRYLAVPEVSLSSTIKNICNWKPMENEVTYVLLNDNDNEFIKIEALFLKTTRKNLVTVDSIERIQNPYLQGRYLLKKLKMSKIYKEEPQEEYLFHGTKSHNVDSICRDNFDWRKNGESVGHKFGQGVSFSRLSHKATFYCNRKKRQKKVLIVAKVLICKTCCGHEDMELPDYCDEYNRLRCDSSQQGNRKVLVKYDDDEFYPAYKITFNVKNPRVYYNYQ